MRKQNLGEQGFLHTMLYNRFRQGSRHLIEKKKTVTICDARGGNYKNYTIAYDEVELPRIFFQNDCKNALLFKKLKYS